MKSTLAGIVLLLSAPAIYAHENQLSDMDLLTQGEVTLLRYHSHDNQYCINQNYFTDTLATLREIHQRFGTPQKAIDNITQIYRDIVKVCSE